MILPILHPCPWATVKFATHGPHYVALWPEIAALGPRACGSTALWRQFQALGRHNVWPWGGKFSSIPRAGVQNYYSWIAPGTETPLSHPILKINEFPFPIISPLG